MGVVLYIAHIIQGLTRGRGGELSTGVCVNASINFPFAVVGFH